MPISPKPSECVLYGRVIEEERAERYRQNQLRIKTLSRKAVLAERAGRHDEAARLRSEVKGMSDGLITREVAAAAVGMNPSTYHRAREVVRAAEADPKAYGDLVDLMDTTTVYHAFGELNARRGKPRRGGFQKPKVVRVPTPEGTDCNAVMERVCSALAGALMGINMIDVRTLDMTRRSAWLVSIHETLNALRTLHKEILTYEGDK